MCAITFANCNEVIIETGQEESVNNQEGADNNNTEEFPENTFPVSEKIKTIPLPPTGQRWIVMICLLMISMPVNWMSQNG